MSYLYSNILAPSDIPVVLKDKWPDCRDCLYSLGAYIASLAVTLSPCTSYFLIVCPWMRYRMVYPHFQVGGM